MANGFGVAVKGHLADTTGSVFRSVHGLNAVRLGRLTEKEEVKSQQ